MGITDAEANPRTKEEEFKFDNISRSSSATRGEVSFVGVKQERVHREGGPRPSIFNPRERNIGKMLDRLIGEYEDQLTARKNEIAGIEAKINDLKSLKEELKEEELKENSE